VDAASFNLTAATLERALTPRTRAVIVVHYGGFPCQMDAVLEIAARHRLAVIEDAAHAPGASLTGKALGTIGDIGCFSFFSNKNLSTGEGGMLVTNRADIAEKVRLMRSHGMTTVTWDRHRGHAYTYDVVDLGYNYRIDEIRSALGLVQLHKLLRGNARRQTIAETYWRAFEQLPIELPFHHADGQSSYHLFPILLPVGIDRIQFIDHMRAEGIQTSIHYPPIHQFSYYARRYPDVSLPITEAVASRQVTLPLYSSMSDQAVKWVIAAVLKSLDEVGT
jgi:dTDP-4-amino-4,6-dideoxygalactose transaminase